MARSCDEERRRKLHEKNYDSRGQRTPQSSTTEEAMGRHDTARHEVPPIKEKNILVTERSGKEGSEWLIPALGGINSSRGGFNILSWKTLHYPANQFYSFVRGLSTHLPINQSTNRSINQSIIV